LELSSISVLKAKINDLRGYVEIYSLEQEQQVFKEKRSAFSVHLDLKILDRFQEIRIVLDVVEAL